MAMLIGQVFNPVFKQTKTEGEKGKTSFRFSLATRKAFIEDKTKANLFTNCVVYQPGLANLLNTHFGKEEDHGKAIALYGHYDEYTWQPDYNNANHRKYFKEQRITQSLMEQAGVKLAEGSVQEFKVLVPIPQTTRQFVVTGFEFADSQSSTARRNTKPVENDGAVIAGQTYTPASDQESPI